MEPHADLERYFRLSLDLLCIADLHGRFVRVNPEWEAALGYPSHELTGRHFLELVHPDDVAATQAAMSRLVGHKEVRAFVNRYRHKDGSYRDIEWRSRTEGDLIYAAARDVTTRREQEAALRTSEARLRAILEHSQDAIGVAVNGIWRTCNPAAVRLFGVSSPEELLGTPTRDVIAVSERERVASLAASRVSGDAPSFYLTRGLRKDGTEFPVEVTVSTYVLDHVRYTMVTLRDITDRERLTQALRESQRQLVEAQKLTTVGSWTMTFDDVGPRWTASEEFYRIWGLPPDATLSAVEGAQRVHPADRERVNAEWASLLAGAASAESEYRLIVDGVVRWIQVRARSEKAPDGRLWRIIGTSQDITARRDTEDRLRTSEAKYRQLFEHMQEGVSLHEVITDADGHVSDFRILEMNEAHERHSGLTRAEAVGRTIRELMPGIDAAQIEAYARVAETGEPLSFEYRSEAFDRWFSVAAFRPSPGRFATIFEDISDRKRGEATMARRHAILEAVRFAAEQFLRTPDWETVSASVLGRLGHAADVSRVVVFQCDFTSVPEVLLNWRAEWAAPGIEPRVGGPQLQNLPLRALGFERWIAELSAGRAVTGVVRDLPAAERPILLAQGIRAAAAVPIVVDDHWWGFIGFDHCDREVSWTDAQIEALRVAARVVGAAVERRQADATRQHLETELRQAQKLESVGRLAGGVAHDFNNMLGVILGSVELAQEKLAAGTDIAAELAQIRKAAAHSAELTRQLLGFARRQPVVPRVLDLNDVVSDALKMLGRLIGEAIRLTWLPGAGLWQVRMDPTQLGQVLANLCVNARDAMAGAGHIRIATENVTCDAAFCSARPGLHVGAYVRLEVTDDGCGMDAVTVERIFEPFFTTKGAGVGTGLGLSMVYGAIKQNGGYIEVVSEVGRGTSFLIYLPPLVTTPAKGLAPAPSVALRGAETVLVVEDQPDLLRLTTTVLTSLGYRVLAAVTPTEALAHVERNRGLISLLLTDVIMPEMSGPSLAAVVQGLEPQIKCLFVSGYPDVVMTSDGMLDSRVNFLQKPYTKPVLAAKVREVLGTGQ